MKIRCIALDLDGTTLNSSGELGRATEQAVRRAVESGIRVAVASGRSLDSLPKAVLDLEGIRYAVTSNGAAVYDIRERKCLIRHTMTERSVREIMRLTEPEKDRVSCETFIDGTPYADSRYVADPVRFGATAHAVSYIRGTRKPVEDIRGFILEHCRELDCIDLVTGSEELKRELWGRIGEIVEDVYLTSSVRRLIEISHKNSGKDAGMRFLTEYLGIRMEETAAFGDGDNDAGLLACAGAGFAVANGSPACKKAADHIVASNDEDGVAQGIGQILEWNQEE